MSRKKIPYSRKRKSSSISFHPDMFKAINTTAKSLGKSRSKYITDLIMRDLISRHNLEHGTFIKAHWKLWSIWDKARLKEDRLNYWTTL